jgi:hypothetical protein
MFVNVLPKLIDKEGKMDRGNYIAFIEVPKRYQTVDTTLSNQLVLDEEEEGEEEDVNETETSQ